MGHQDGTIITNNFIHEIYGFATGGWGIKMDGGSRGITVTKNIIYYSNSAAVYQYFGSDNLIQNNILSFVDYDYKDGALVSGTAAGKCDQSQPNFLCASFKFINNIVYLDTIEYSDLLKDDNQGMVNMTLNNNIYYTIKDPISKVKFPPKNKLTWEKWQKEGKDTQSLYTDPKFVDPYNLNFNLQPDSPAYSLGF